MNIFISKYRFARVMVVPLLFLLELVEASGEVIEVDVFCGLVGSDGVPAGDVGQVGDRRQLRQGEVPGGSTRGAAGRPSRGGSRGVALTETGTVKW